jgi:ubiquinone/menaquinone biosynthesis C-methylase UbiE
VGEPDPHPRETRGFFAPRAATWEQRFPDDDPVYADAVARLGLRAGQAVLDAGCGSGRALPPMRDAVGPDGTVIGVDLTPEMLAAARDHGRLAVAALLLADTRFLPLRDAGVDAVLAAGLLPHLPDPAAGVAELARVTRPGGRLAVFHPVSREMLAARKGRRPDPDGTLARVTLERLLTAGGWRLDTYEDTDHFLALATRVP